MSTFGHVFRVTTAGESHGRSVTAIVDNCPPGLSLTEDDIQPQLTRRRPGQSAISTPRNEFDRVEIQSGTENGLTLGTPIALRVLNEDQRPHDYKTKKMDLYPRPSHADWTYLEKYGIKASSGGGRSSARETIARVAAGAIAEKVLREAHGIEIVAFVSSTGDEFLFPPTPEHPTATTQPGFQKLLETITRKQVDAFQPCRCPDADVSARMVALIEKVRDAHDSIGGVITCVIRNMPAGLGEPCFDKLEAVLAHAMMSIPSTKAFSIGSGFGGCQVRGSRHNDSFLKGTGDREKLHLTTKTNNSGGVQGGISNGAHIYFDVGFKPPATIGQEQTTANYDGQEVVVSSGGRHDPCVVPRAIPIVEAMAALTILDAVLVQRSRTAMMTR
ncbi:bifunctional chorismate synthase/riboflavin reductase [NAD(P)H] aro2 [Imshaugia aleurites]|uniref:chorismate synthase n=1 Tax=Imshaugia aleurites TaxID=172621 RepID=A0A8H3IAZ3_9LECA|nr:bifunctional chorismate synthase/riboflavin reductase [NAD(P)H] aro2 [Imshaugia aleurites]